MIEFKEKYSYCLNYLMRTLDEYIVGKWKEIDYDLHNCRSHFSCISEEDAIVIRFGDKNTKSLFINQLIIYFEENNNTIRIKDMQSLKGSGYGSYSKDIMELIGREFSGKTNEEVKQEKNKSLWKRRV